VGHSVERKLDLAETGAEHGELLVTRTDHGPACDSAAAVGLQSWTLDRPGEPAARGMPGRLCAPGGSIDPDGRSSGQLRWSRRCCEQTARDIQSTTHAKMANNTHK